MTSKMFRFGTALALSAAMLTMAGCADQSSPDAIDKRSVERWNYLIAHQAEKAYDYLSPGFRATKARDDYAAAMNNRPVQWKEARFKSKTCDEDSCQVKVDITYSVMMPGAAGAAQSSAVTTTQNETWVLADGAWYFLPK